MAALICPFADICGGCDNQATPYALQVAEKDATLRTLFGPDHWKPFIASPGEFPIYYRNKIRFSFMRKEGAIWPSRHGKDGSEIAVDRCLLQSTLCEEIILFTAEFANRHDWTLHNEGGWLKHLILREGKQTGEAMLCLVTDAGPFVAEETWIEEVRRQFPTIVSLYHCVAAGKRNDQIVDRLIWGSPTLKDRIAPYTFTVSPHAFFQTNGAMVETLYQTIATSANLHTSDVLWDLYAGSATIGIFLSSQVNCVVSVENNPQNISDARRNIEQNQITNITLLDQSVEQLMQGPSNLALPNLVIVDPPRAGLSLETKEGLTFLQVKRIVYVSCNPASCLRDCQWFETHGFQIVSLQGIDMFPHTVHCEIVAVLDRH